jgi:hypothetical protein
MEQEQTTPGKVAVALSRSGLQAHESSSIVQMSTIIPSCAGVSTGACQTRSTLALQLLIAVVKSICLFARTSRNRHFEVYHTQNAKLIRNINAKAVRAHVAFAFSRTKRFSVCFFVWPTTVIQMRDRFSFFMLTEESWSSAICLRRTGANSNPD